MKRIRTKTNTAREVAKKCEYPEGGDWETPAQEAKLEKTRSNRKMDDARNKMEAQTEEASAALEGASGCARDKKRKHERRDTNADRRRSCWRR